MCQTHMSSQYEQMIFPTSILGVIGVSISYNVLSIALGSPATASSPLIRAHLRDSVCCTDKRQVARGRAHQHCLPTRQRVRPPFLPSLSTQLTASRRCRTGLAICGAVQGAVTSKDGYSARDPAALMRGFSAALWTSAALVGLGMGVAAFGIRGGQRATGVGAVH